MTTKRERQAYEHGYKVGYADGYSQGFAHGEYEYIAKELKELNKKNKVIEKERKETE